MAAQVDRPFEVTTPLGSDVLLLLRMTGTEELGRLFTYQLDLLSLDHDIAIADVLGQSMTVRVDVPGSDRRYFNGIVSQFSYAGSYGQYARYSAILRPWLWFLSRTADCKIFPNKSSVDILQEICGDLGFSDIAVELGTMPEPKEYCVQYRETAYNFVSRLLEHDGVYFYFKHTDGKHELVLADGVGSHATVSGYEEIPFFPEGSASSPEDDRFLEWYVGQELQTTAFAHTDYDFTKPKADLLTRSTVTRDHAQASFEIYDYPGIYMETGPGETIARTRIQELQAQYELAHGSGTVRGIGAGALFALTDHPRSGLNKSYLVVSASYELNNPEFETGGGADPSEPIFQCHVTAIDEQTQYRAPRITPKPSVEGPQTATVVGQGDDVWTDEYGRVKVQFHWDRVGTNDEDSSCWIRVSQNWAGKNWGGMFIPHIGQEVIVDFLEGDPDQPIITGRVYNQDNMPPLTLPDAKLKSIIRDNYGNQIIFDATPGDEHIQIFSPHHNSAIELGRSVRIKSKDDFHSVSEADYFEAIIGLTSQIFIGGKGTLTVGASADVFIGYKLGVHVGGKHDIYKGSQSTFVYGNKTEMATGFKVTRAAQKEYKQSADDFTRRSEGKIILDSRSKLTLNAGAKDNGLINMGDNEVVIDYGEDGADTTPASSLDAAAAAHKAVSAATLAWAAGMAAVTGMSLLGEGFYNTSSDGVSNEMDRNQVMTMAGTLGLGAGGFLWMAYSAESEGAQIAMERAQSAVGDSKTEQDKTYSRIKLHKDGIKIMAYDSGSASGEPDAEIHVNKAGDILIKAKTKGIKIEAKDKIEIKSDANIELTSTQGDIKLKGMNVNIEGSPKIVGKTMVELG